MIRDLLTDLIVEHASPGRFRLRFPSKRGDVLFFNSVVSAMKEHPAINEISANPRTGSVLVLHSLSPAEVQELIQLNGTQPRPSPRQARARDAGPIDPKPLAAAGLRALSLLQFARGRALGSASEQLWHAFQARQLNIPRIFPLLIAFALLQLVRGRVLSPASTLFMYSLLSRTVGRDEGDLSKSAPAHRSRSAPEGGETYSTSSDSARVGVYDKGDC